MEISEVLAQSEFFRALSPQSRETLESLCIQRELKNKQVLFHEGEKGHSLFIQVRGQVQLWKSTPDGREVVIRVIKQGEIFGEVILFEREDYPVSATAVKDGGVILLPKNPFLQLLAQEDFRNDFISMLLKKLRYLADQMVSRSQSDVEDRFREFIKNQYGERDVYRIGISKKDIAAAIGTVPETLSRLFQRLKKEGKAEWIGKTLKANSSFWRLK